MSLFVKETGYLSWNQFNRAWSKLKKPSKESLWSEAVAVATQGQTNPKSQVNPDQFIQFAYEKHEYDKLTNTQILTVLSGVAEIARRIYGLEPRLVQIYAAYSLVRGRVVEQKTGEGKTLVAAMGAVTLALFGRRVVVVTTNDYLAYRDRSFTRQLAAQFYLTVDSVLSSDDFDMKRNAYASSICYATHQVFGFDYLHDQLAINKEMILQKDRDAVIVDEADMVLIDDARTPLIVSGATDERDAWVNDFRIKANAVVKTLSRDDVDIDEKFNSVQLSKSGIVKVQEALGIDDLFDKKYMTEQHLLHNALQAHYIQLENRNYVLREDKIELVDDSTGRILEGRRLSEGLHEALEAKHGLAIQADMMTYRQVTYQELFKKVKHLAGLTGTARPEDDEFYQVYGLEITSVPTYKPVIRQDKPDMLFPTKLAKWRGVAKAVRKYHDNNQPVLIGTISIEDSEAISRVLSEEGLSHNVLNALNPEAEALIISHGGEHTAITVATNMAGRGVDIKLDEVATKAGGLVVIGCDHNRSPRIDNQLRGRSGRQGDPGVSQFYISLEDDFMRQFMTDSNKAILSKALTDEGVLLAGMQRPLQKQINRMQLEASAMDSGSRTQTARFAQAFSTISDELNNARFGAVTGSIARSWRLAKKWGPIDELRKQFDEDTSWTDDNNKREFLVSAVLYAFDVAYRDMLEQLEYYRTSVSMLSYGGDDIFYRYTQLLREEVLPRFNKIAYDEFTNLIKNERFTSEAVLRRFETMSAERQSENSEAIEFLKREVEAQALGQMQSITEQEFLDEVANAIELRDAPNRKARRNLKKKKKGGRRK